MENETRCADAERKIKECFANDNKATVEVQATVDDGVSRVEASITALDGSMAIRTVKTGAADDIDAVVEAAISELNYQGAVAILN